MSNITTYRHVSWYVSTRGQSYKQDWTNQLLLLQRWRQNGRAACHKRVELDVEGLPGQGSGRGRPLAVPGQKIEGIRILEDLIGRPELFVGDIGAGLGVRGTEPVGCLAERRRRLCGDAVAGVGLCAVSDRHFDRPGADELASAGVDVLSVVGEVVVDVGHRWQRENGKMFLSQTNSYQLSQIS